MCKFIKKNQERLVHKFERKGNLDNKNFWKTKPLLADKINSS